VDEANDTWREWLGSIWGQPNPLTTEADGYLAFYPLPGKYRLYVSAGGFERATSPILTVVDGPLYYNLALTPLDRVYLPLVFRNR